MNTLEGKEKQIDCYKSSQKILSVGEGDFSFSACLAQAFGTAVNIVATSYLSRNRLVQEHGTSTPHLEELMELGCLLLYKVDVHKMHTHPILKNMKFDIIIYNFPHAGHYHKLREDDWELIWMHRELVGAYFKTASKMLNEGGEVHLRHRDDPPYDSWNVVWLAGKAGLKLKEKVSFFKSDYPGYRNIRGGGVRTNQPFPISCAFTFKFSLDLPKVIDHHPKNAEVRDHDADLRKKDEVYALEMTDQVHDQKHQKSVEVDNTFLKDEVDDDLLKKDEVNDDLYVHRNYEVIDLHGLEIKVHFQEESACEE